MINNLVVFSKLTKMGGGGGGGLWGAINFEALLILWSITFDIINVSFSVLKVHLYLQTFCK